MISHQDYHDRIQRALADSSFQKAVLELNYHKEDDWEKIIDDNGFSRNNMIVGVVVPGYNEVIYREYQPLELYDLLLGFYQSKYEYMEYISANKMPIERETEYYHTLNIINFLALPYTRYENMKSLYEDFIYLRHRLLNSKEIQQINY
ncbi:MAG: hypothetical protein SFU91_11445 [Chloroherpetonaceae bacterium]|nr:hypothetical protein [Chloroherpetonaceae bacterium]